MNNNHKRFRWRFSLRTLIVAVFVLCAFFAANLSAGKPQLMFRFDEQDGGGSVYAVPFGWPLPYLRVPTGEYARLPSDLNLPGLMVDLGIGALLLVTIFFLRNMFHRVRSKLAATA